MRLPELRMDFVAEVSAGVSRTPLSLFLEFPAEGPLLAAEYRTASYDPATIDALLDHLLALLAGGVAEPDRPIGELPMLCAAELAAVVEDGNRTAAPYPPRCLHELVSLSSLGFPHRVAVSGAGDTLTYAELDARANRLAHHLVARGAGPGTRVGVALRRDSRMVVALLAVLKTGAAYLPVDPE
ncbi:MAG TPA: AMP-binding protein, partial [Pseudonocardiaceae bacterium]